MVKRFFGQIVLNLNTRQDEMTGVICVPQQNCDIAVALQKGCIGVLILYRWGAAACLAENLHRVKDSKWERYAYSIAYHRPSMQGCASFVPQINKMTGWDSRLTRRGTTNSRDHSGRGAASAEDAQGAPAQIHISPSIQVSEENISGSGGWSAVSYQTLPSSPFDEGEEEEGKARERNERLCVCV